MSINVLMNSIINKLLTQNTFNNNNLVFNSDQAVKKQKELKSIVNNLQINQSSFIVLGTFLQNTNLDLFSKEELRHLLSYNYEDLQSSKILNNEFKYDYKLPLYDLDNTLINAPYYLSSQIQTNFKKLQGINKNLSLEYLINYLVTQI